MQGSYFIRVGHYGHNHPSDGSTSFEVEPLDGVYCPQCPSIINTEVV